MKNRKFKLIASVLSLISVFAIMSVGVWAVAGQVVNVTTTVKFIATSVTGKMTGTLTGADQATYYYNSDNTNLGTPLTFSPSIALEDWVLGNATELNIDSVDGIPSNLVYTFTITNDSTTDAIVDSIDNLTVGNNLSIVSVTQDTNLVNPTEGSYKLENIAPSASTTIIITIKVTDVGVSIASANISFTINLASINTVTQ